MLLVCVIVYLIDRQARVEARGSGLADCRTSAAGAPGSRSAPIATGSRPMLRACSLRPPFPAARMTAFRLTPLSFARAADVEGLDLTEPLDANTLAQLRAAWLEHLVLRFRGQVLTAPQLLAFSRQLGELDPPGRNPCGAPFPDGAQVLYGALFPDGAQVLYGAPFNPDHPEINVISNLREGDRPLGNLGDGEAVWHQDMTCVEAPPRASMLMALEVPPEGGDTFWSNLQPAWDALPADLCREVSGRVAIHDSTCHSAGMMRRGMKPVTDPREAPGARHPRVVVHPKTGRPMLLLGRRRNACVPGLPLADSEALLDARWAHATQPAFAFRQQWQVGDLLLWDNRSTRHRRDAFDPASRRRMHRTRIRGAVPVPVPADVGQALAA